MLRGKEKRPPLTLLKRDVLISNKFISLNYGVSEEEVVLKKRIFQVLALSFSGWSVLFSESFNY